MTPDERILDCLRQNMLPRQVVERTGYSYADVGRVIREHGGLNAIKGASGDQKG